MKRAAQLIAMLSVFVGATAVSAQNAEQLPAYLRVASLKGTVVLSGSSAVATFARVWAVAFQRIYPGVAVNVVAKSSGAAAGDMTANPATVGMTSRAMNATERENYAKQHGEPPMEFRVAIDAVAVYVFKDNPLKSISIAQLERVFSATPKNNASIERWSQLGLEGLWGQRPVTPIGFGSGRGAYEIMRELVLRGGDFNANVTAEPVSTSVVQAVGVDPGAIGYASVYYRTARTKVLPVESNPGELAYPTESDAAGGKYPLSRYLYLYLGTPRVSGTDAAAREFLRFILSEEGQGIARASGAFAIPPPLAHSQRAALSK